ncbi:hypothetical protein [Saliniramus sp.]|uniref:hypothetical protein n=1 Tax=Saliniramus sp. TaxID=2986772 RepID=UPI002C97538F|nr:hypothetical protein [Saliniramus sp.]HMB11025.1 hypothetical protein [Saliniramus sp.]
MAVRTLAQLSVKSMSRNLVDTIRLFCTVAIIVAAIAQLASGLTEPAIFLLSTLVAALVIGLPKLLRAIWPDGNTAS